MSRRTGVLATVLVVATLTLAAVSIARGSPATPAYQSSPANVITPPPIQTPGAIPFTQPIDRPAHVLIMGTSLFAGYYTESPQQRYSNIILSEMAKQGPVDKITAPRPPGGLTFVTSYPSLPRGVDVAVIELGTNEITAKSVDTFQRNYDAMLTQFRQRDPKAALVCLGTWSNKGAAYDRVISDLCQADRGTYVPLVDLYNVPEMRGPYGEITPLGSRDNFHPNEAGHAAIAERVLRVIYPTRGLVPKATPSVSP